MTYQHVAAEAYGKKDNAASMHNCETLNNGLFGFPPRMESCQWRAGWPYVQALKGFPSLRQIHTGPPTDKDGRGKPLLVSLQNTRLAVAFSVLVLAQPSSKCWSHSSCTGTKLLTVRLDQMMHFSSRKPGSML